MTHALKTGNGIRWDLLRDVIFLKIANWITPLTHDYSGWERKNRILRKCGLSIGENVAIDRGFFFLHGHGNNITIGDYSAIGLNCKMYSFNSVSIGGFCMFASDVTLSNGFHDADSLEPSSTPLVIGDGCWVGTGAKIVAKDPKGLTIGSHAVIGAGSLVINDVPPLAIVAGVPAKVLRYRELPDKVWHLGNTWFNPRALEVVKE